MSIFDRIFPPRKLTLANGQVIEEKRSRSIVIVPLILILLYLTGKMTGFKLTTLIKKFHQFTFILGKIFTPNFDYIPRVVGPLIETIKMSFLGSFLGAVVALPFAYLASTNMVDNKIVNWIVRLMFSLLRTIPTIVNALVATFIVGTGAFAGTIAIFIYSFSYIGKLTYEQIENVNMGAFEALISMGLTRRMAFMKAVLPQILPTFIATALYNFEGNVRYASILGYVGAGGVGILIKETIGFRMYENLGAILILIFITIVLIESISDYFRKKLIRGE